MNTNSVGNSEALQKISVALNFNEFVIHMRTFMFISHKIFNTIMAHENNYRFLQYTVSNQT